MRARWFLRGGLGLAMLGVLSWSCVSCEDLLGALLEDPCDAAKQHLCEKLPGQGCSTATMDNAVTRLRDECGADEASAYIAQAEPACRAGTLVCSSSGCGPTTKLTYTGTAEADGRTARLELTLDGTSVTGRLEADPVCSGSVRLTRTEIFIRSATLVGGAWEAEGSSISGSWDGADYDCAGAKMPDYPTSGNVTISVSGGKVSLQRISGAGRYVFDGQGLKHTPNSSCGSDAGAGSGSCPGSSIADAGPNPVDMGSLLTLTGSGFGAVQGTSQVLFDATPATYVESWSDTQIVVGVPNITEGKVRVAVAVGGKFCRGYEGLQVYYGGCVGAGTRVALAGGGVRRIEEVREGDRVLSVDPASKRVRPAIVKKVLVHAGRSYTLNTLRLTSGQELQVTGNHPVLTSAEQWLPVDALEPGAEVYAFDPTSERAVRERIVAIVREKSQADTVYNLLTTAGNYFANDLLVHNKCLAQGSLIDTPGGPRPVEALRPGDVVYGDVDGARVSTRVIRVFEKRTEADGLPGKRLTPHVAVTNNHLLQVGSEVREAGLTENPDEQISGPVYDLETETGNYFADGIRMRTAAQQ